MPSIDQKILEYIAENPNARKDDIRRNAAPRSSDTTVWRALKKLLEAGKLEVSGKGPATSYAISGSSVVRTYLQTPYNKRPPVVYKKSFIDNYVPNKTFYLSVTDRKILQQAGKPNIGPIPAGTYAKLILAQLLVDLSWASSRMEGNTYDILQTERLIRYGEEVSGKDQKEALMILNHKEAIQYVVDNLDDINYNRGDFFNIHALLSDGLLADPAMAGRLRVLPVGISHSSYTPLNDAVAIEEEFNIILAKAHEITDPFEQSFFLLVHIPYLQAFIDINKRTSRIASNIPLLKADLAPMSFLSMNDSDYIDGLIGIYELNNVALLREVYVESYLASAIKYNVMRAEVETPEKAATVYRNFVREAVRHCVLVAKSFQTDDIMALAKKEDIPEADLGDVVAYVGRQFDSLHEGNAIRYRLKPEDLEAIQTKETP